MVAAVAEVAAVAAATAADAIRKRNPKIRSRNTRNPLSCPAVREGIFCFLGLRRRLSLATDALDGHCSCVALARHTARARQAAAKAQQVTAQ